MTTINRGSQGLVTPTAFATPLTTVSTIANPAPTGFESCTEQNAQQAFDARYITSTEILKRLRIARSSLLLARNTGRLPGAIRIQGQTFVWERERVEPYLAAWGLLLGVRRSGGR